MKVELKIWRYDGATGTKALKPYEVDVSDEATLLDTLDVVKDKVDGSLAYRKSCRMMICGSCGMRVNGGAVLACKTRISDLVADGNVPVISAMGNLPVIKDLVVDMEPFWAKMRAVEPWLRPGLRRRRQRRRTSSARAGWTSSTRSRSASTAGAASPSATRWRPIPTSSGRRRSRRASASWAMRATARRSSGSSATPSHMGSGTAPAATSATSAARRVSTRATRSRSSAPRR